MRRATFAWPKSAALLHRCTLTRAIPIIRSTDRTGKFYQLLTSMTFLGPHGIAHHAFFA
jgi:hypothetical protein